MSSLQVNVKSPKKETTRAASFFLSPYGTLVIFIILVLSVWAGQTAIAILTALVLAAAGLSRLWSYWSLKGVQIERKLSEKRAFPGERLELTLRIANRKLLPLSWIQIDDEIPSGMIKNQNSLPASRPGCDVVSRSISMLWYSAVNWKLELDCKKRGYYALGPLAVTSGDIFGFYQRTFTRPDLEYITVYPQVHDISNLAVPSLYPLGDARSDNRIYEDPSRTIGLRDYLPGDSLRRIHWKASVRRQQLQVKIFESTTTLNAALFLDADGYQDIEMVNDANLSVPEQKVIFREDDFELAVSTAASLANYLVNKNSRVALRSNSKLADSGLPAVVNSGRGVDKLVEILDALAKVTPAVSSSFFEYFQNERKTLTQGATLIFVLADISENVRLLLTDLRESGRQLLVFQVGQSKSEAVSDIPWFKIRQSGDLAVLSDGISHD